MEGRSWRFVLGASLRLALRVASGNSNLFLTNLSNLGFLSSHPGAANKKTSTRLVFLFGAPGGIRTPDHLVRSQVLYPAELQARNSFKLSCTVRAIEPNPISAILLPQILYYSPHP